MRARLLSLALGFLHLNGALCSPLALNDQALEARNDPAINICKAVTVIVSKLQLEKATPFCSSFLHISPKTVTIIGSSTTTVTVTSQVDTTVIQTITSVPTVSSTTSVTQNILSTDTSTITAIFVAIATANYTINVETITGVASTRTTFLAGNPPAKLRRHEQPEPDKSDESDESAERKHPRQKATPVPTPNCVKPLPGQQISQACSCLNIPTPTSTISQQTVFTSTSTFKLASTGSSVTTVAGSPVTSVSTVTVFQTSRVQALTTVSTASVTVATYEVFTVTVTVAAPTSTSTIYPCATPLPTLSPRIPYGDSSSANSLAILGLSSSVFSLDTPEGNSALACCNACLFQLPNCVQANFFSYLGCNVYQATDLSSGSGKNISATCPAGTFAGLSYGPDVAPYSGSTGNIIGPCGQSYTDL